MLLPPPLLCLWPVFTAAVGGHAALKFSMKSYWLALVILVATGFYIYYGLGLPGIIKRGHDTAAVLEEAKRGGTVRPRGVIVP